MIICVCPLSSVQECVTNYRPDRIVSMLDPAFAFPDVGINYFGKHLLLRFHDIHSPSENEVMPSTTHVTELLSFLDKWNREKPILIHCRAGIGRSPATAFIATCLVNPETDERKIAANLRHTAPHVRPNQTLVKIADQAMNRNGRMIDAIIASAEESPPTSVAEGCVFELPSIL